jgi:hypothetical protein
MEWLLYCALMTTPLNDLGPRMSFPSRVECVRYAATIDQTAVQCSCSQPEKDEGIFLPLQ